MIERLAELQACRNKFVSWETDNDVKRWTVSHPEKVLSENRNNR